MSDNKSKRVFASRFGEVAQRSEIMEIVNTSVGGRPEAFLDFVEALQEAARNTAEHVETNWQDHKIAVRWSRLAASLEKVRVAYSLHAREMGLRT